ncbi:Uncharacterised protein [Staphylococcus aureus]|nr:Uncharacterised protein [Staphylococcus aureus]SUK11225.1 Uncharacterised protein [Staphylococcus aureus]
MNIIYMVLIQPEKEKNTAIILNLTLVSVLEKSHLI